MLIFKGVYYLRKHFNNNINRDVLFTQLDSGFLNNKLALKWLYYFKKFTIKRTKGQYRMLIFDKHGSYIT
jgi:hypothetical protein